MAEIKERGAVRIVYIFQILPTATCQAVKQFLKQEVFGKKENRYDIVAQNNNQINYAKFHCNKLLKNHEIKEVDN